ncbi:RPA-related protein RADX-like isoform X1 [Rhincodon typus]|uniref:RPA-related protein RADX-like isoform X1 n=1 Tax=Rhincodon typus TaxID=259920 RepID=UPI002030EF2D|nr:RPA-related protein RADX-like isoform X1 [Rhincodon typus]
MEVGELQKCAFKAMFPAAIADFRPFRSSQVCQEPVVVLSVERYPRDPGSGGGLWEAPGGGDLYDLSLSEGHCRLRAVLQPSLNWMVRRNLLSSGCELSEVRLGLQYDERRLGVGVQVFVLLEAQVVSTGGCGATPAVRRLKPQKLYVFNEGTELPFGPELPIKAKRRYYLPLWDTVDYNGEAWHRHPPGQPIQQFEGSCSIDVRLLEGYTQQKKKDLPPVIVRILRKFRLYHFGRPDKYSECPFQAKFLVADKSGSATLVLWNSLCMDWYRHLEPGMVVRLHNYVVKKSYTTRMGHHPEVSNEPALELNLNPRNPAAEITVINAKNVREEWHLPELQYCFATRKEVSGLCAGDLCSIVGFVTFVGRQERIRNKERPDEFLVYRWLHLLDGTASEPFVLKLFSTSQPEIQSQISPCSLADNTVTLLVCTNVRLECKMIDPSGQTAFPYLQSTEYSQVYVNGHHHGKLYVKNPKVKEFINWIQSAKDQERDTLSHTQIGGCYTYPPLPPSERDYRREILGMSPLTTMSELKQYLNQLEYREYRQVTVQGRIKSVKYQLLGRMDEEFTEVYNAVGGTEECEELLDADQPFRGTRGNKSPVIPVMSGPPPKKQAGLSKKRKRKGAFCERKCTPVRLGKDTESTGEEENPTHHLRKHEKDMNRDASPGKALNFIKACEEFCTDSDDMEETPSAMSLAHPIFSWTACPSQQEHIAHRGDISQMVARRFHFRDKSLLLKTFGLQPSNFSGIPAGQIEDLEHCEPACCCGYYTVTILGLNEELSLDAIFLPIISRLDHRAMYPAKHSNTLISILAHGGPASSQTCHTGTDSAESSTPSPGDILRSAVGLEEMLFIFILDICNQGGTNVEVVLNRAYVQHRAL